MSLAPVPRTVALVATLSALGLPAAAQSVKVNVAGLDDKTAHVQIVKAAQAALALFQSALPFELWRLIASFPGRTDSLAVSATDERKAPRRIVFLPRIRRGVVRFAHEVSAQTATRMKSRLR